MNAILAKSAQQFSRPPSDEIHARVLAANINEAVTVPTGGRFVLFSATADFYFRPGTVAAAVPAADVTDGTGSELNPVLIDLKDQADVTQFQLIAPAATVVTMCFYR